MLYPMSMEKDMSISRWNVAPTFISPNDIRLNLNMPHFIINVVLSLLG